MSITEDVYEVRYGWTRRTIILVSSSVLFTLAALFGLGMPLLLRVAALVLFGGGAGLMSYNCASGKVALRVDAAGILLGGSPVRYAATTTFIPWAEAAAVELWVQRIHSHYRTVKMPYVGVHRTGPVPVGAVGRAAVALTGKSPELVANSRAVNGWPFETRVFLDAVARHAPQARVTVAEDFPATR